MLSAFVAAVTAIGTALGELSKAVSAYLGWQQTQQATQAGIDAQRVKELEAENAVLRTQLAALQAAAGTPGSARL